MKPGTRLIFSNLILDVLLPGIDGYEVCKLIKTRHPSMKVIAISGSAVKETKDKILEAGADVFINKPFDAAALLKELQ